MFTPQKQMQGFDYQECKYLSLSFFPDIAALVNELVPYMYSGNYEKYTLVQIPLAGSGSSSDINMFYTTQLNRIGLHFSFV